MRSTGALRVSLSIFPRVISRSLGELYFSVISFSLSCLTPVHHLSSAAILPYIPWCMPLYHPPPFVDDFGRLNNGYTTARTMSISHIEISVPGPPSEASEPGHVWHAIRAFE